MEAFSQGHLDVVDELLAPDAVDHASRPPGMPEGREGLKVLIGTLRTAFPDFNITIEQQVAEGDLVVTRSTNSGTMQGEFGGMPASGKRASWGAIHITRIANGKIVEHWAIEDQLTMLQQLGFVPTPEAVPAG